MTKITLTRQEGYKFEAKNSLGKTAILDGPTSIGGSDDGLRPMEMLLIGLAGCSGFDVLSMLIKGRQDVEDMEISVEGERSDDIPKVFTEIKVHFKISGKKLSEKRVNDAINLSMDKYCSVSAMLCKVAEISSTHEVIQN